MSTGWWVWLLVTMASFGVAACEEATEGCLDYRALAVDIYAEKACDECCTYPRLTLQQVAGRVEAGAIGVITTNTPLLGASGDSIRLIALVYYLHDLELEFADGRRVALADTFGFRQNTTASFELQTRSLVKSAPLRQTEYRVGRLLDTGTVVGLRANFGLPAEYAAGLPTAQTTSSALALGQDTLLYDDTAAGDGRYRSAYFQTMASDSTVATSFVDHGTTVPLRFVLGEPLRLDRSFNLNLTLLLPVTPLIDFPSGTITAEAFVESFLADASITSASTSR